MLNLVFCKDSNNITAPGELAKKLILELHLRNSANQTVQQEGILNVLSIVRIILMREKKF